MTRSQNFRIRSGIRGLLIAAVTGTLFLIFNALLYADASKVDATRIVINTSGPVVYRHMYRADPPRIIFRFLQNTVYTSMQESVVIQKGMVKEIEASYFEEDPVPGAKKPLKTLTFHLLADAPYDVFEGPQSLILVIRHPGEIPGGNLTVGKVTLTALPTPTFQDEGRQKELTGAFHQAMVRMSPLTEQTPPVEETAPFAGIEGVQQPFGTGQGSLQESLQKDRFPVKAIQPPKGTQVPPTIQPLQVSPSVAPWNIRSSFFYAIILFFILGGLLWPPSWFSIQNRILRRERRRSWEMAKRIIGLKEESVSREEHYTKEIHHHEKQERFLQSQIGFLKEADRKLRQEAKTLFGEKVTLKKELERGTRDLHELARERIELSDRLQKIRLELQELSARYDQEISGRRDLETALEVLKDQRKEISSGALGEEKRRWTRLPIFPTKKQDLPLAVEVQGPAGRLIYGYPKDLSLGGISFELEENVELPDPLSLTLFFPKQKSGITTQGKVIWKVQGGQKSHYGICFVDLSQNGSVLIRQFVKERFPQMEKARRMSEETLDEKHPA